jgi:hypothetical protein
MEYVRLDGTAILRKRLPILLHFSQCMAAGWTRSRHRAWRLRRETRSASSGEGSFLPCGLVLFNPC